MADLPPITQTPITSNVAATGTDLRSQYQAKLPQTLVFPSDLRNVASNYPLMQFQIVEYPVNSQSLLMDLEGQSSKVGPNKKAGQSTVKNQTNTNPLLVPKDGINPGSKGTVKSTVVLPITNNITNSLNIDWQMEDFAAGEAFLQGAAGLVGDIKNAMNGGGSIFDALKAGVGTVDAAAKQLAAATLSNALQKTLNVIANPKKQAFFYGVQPRHFQFDWAFTPQNVQEAQTVINIIETFSTYALPTVANGSLLFNFPNEFWITFSGVQGFPVLDPMVCVGIVSNYTPNTLQLLASGHPVQILFSAAFLETTIRTADRPGI